MWDERVDAAIDEVARQMTAGEPHGAFRARVLARIAGRETSRANVRIVWALSRLAAAALIVAAVVMFRGASSRRVSQITPSDVAQALRPGVDAASKGTPSSGADQGRPLRDPDSGSRHDPDSSTARPERSSTERASELDALAPPPLDVAPIDVAPLAPTDSIRVERLDIIAPIAVAPLEGNGPTDDPRPETND